MAKEWILNSVMNRFQLNFKRNVGTVSEAKYKGIQNTDIIQEIQQEILKLK